MDGRSGHPKAVVVGTGFGCLTHVRALRRAGYDVQAVVGRDRERTQERARRFEVARWSTSIDEALALSDIDTVTIATPPHTHAPIALAAIAAGKHVLCEKPFTRDASEARKLLDAAEDAGIVHLVGTEFRFATAQALTARLVADGAIGEPRLAIFLLHIPLLADPSAEVPDWWSDTEKGGGWLGAHAAHVIDQIRVTVGEFEGVSAGLSHVAERAWSAEDSYTVRFRLRSDVEGVMESTAADRGPLLITMRIAGTRGTIWIDGNTVWVADRSGAREVPAPDELRLDPPEPPPADMLVTAYDLLHATGIDVAPYTRLYETFRKLIEGRPVPPSPPAPTFADGVAAMAVMDAIRRSAADQAWVPVATGDRSGAAPRS